VDLDKKFRLDPYISTFAAVPQRCGHGGDDKRSSQHRNAYFAVFHEE